MIKLPDNDKVKRVLFELNGESAYGPDGFTGAFFQICWDIVGDEVTRMIKHSFVVMN